MKFSAALLAAATAVSATEPLFSVNNFSAGCIPHSSQCYWQFDVYQLGTMETADHAVECQFFGTANGLPDLKDAPCKNSSRTFDITSVEGGWNFDVTQPITPSSNQTGVHFIPASDVETSTEPNASVQKYVGPTSFTLDN